MHFKPNKPHRDEIETESPLKQLESNIIKWPFIVGDVLLVITSLTVAFANGGPLTAPEFACCILGVGLGSALAFFPYWIDHSTNARLRILTRFMEQRDGWRLALEQELISAQQSDHRQIKELRNEIASLKASIAQAPQDIAPQATPQEDIEAPAATLTAEPKAEELPLQEGEPMAQPAIPSKPDNIPSFTTKPTTLLSKAIAQAQKNKPSKTVNRLIKGMVPKQESPAS